MVTFLNSEKHPPAPFKVGIEETKLNHNKKNDFINL